MATNYTPQDAFNRAYAGFAQAQANALPSPQSLDTASARVRSRIEGRQAGLENQIRDNFAGRGQANSGGQRQALQASRNASQGAYATGLADALEDYENRRQAGASILNQTASGFGTLGLGRGQLGLDTERLRLDERLGLGGLGLKERELGIEKDLGQQEIDLNRYLGDRRLTNEEAALEEERQSRLARTLVDFMNSFGAIGNRKFFTGPNDARGIQRQGQFDSLVQEIFNSTGLFE